MASIEKRTNDKGEPSYRVKVRLKGHPVQTATFTRLTDARRWGQQTETGIREGRYFSTIEAKRHTLAEMIDRYTSNVIPRKGVVGRDYNRHLAWWKETIGSYTLADVTPALIVEQRDRLAAETVSKEGKVRSHATVNRYLAALSHAFTVAVNEWGWVENSPMRKVSRLKEPRGRVRFLEDGERTALLKACEQSKLPELKLIVVLALSTGARQGEIMGLQWKQVDFERGVITLEETKNGERRVLPLTGYAKTLLEQHGKVRRLDSLLVFPDRGGKRPVNIRAAWNNTLEAAGIEDFRFHDLRHSAASYLAMNGASLAEIAEVLGHKTLQMVKRYAHLSEAHTANVVASMNERIFG